MSSEAIEIEAHAVERACVHVQQVACRHVAAMVPPRSTTLPGSPGLVSIRSVPVSQFDTSLWAE